MTPLGGAACRRSHVRARSRSPSTPRGAHFREPSRFPYHLFQHLLNEYNALHFFSRWRGWGKFCNGNFYANGLLLQKGIRLGTATNNYAEAFGLALALKLSLRWCFGVVEQLSQAQQTLWHGVKQHQET